MTGDTGDILRRLSEDSRPWPWPDCHELQVERDALRAEVERLTKENGAQKIVMSAAMDSYNESFDKCDALRADNEANIALIKELADEREQLKNDLKELQAKLAAALIKELADEREQLKNDLKELQAKLAAVPWKQIIECATLAEDDPDYHADGAAVLIYFEMYRPIPEPQP